MAKEQVKRSQEPEFQVLKELETDLNNSYSSMLLNMDKVIITQIQQKVNKDARSVK